jgi:predicted transcriptional regulator
MKIKLSKVLEREMKKRSLNVTNLSRQTGIPRTTVHDWLMGRLPSSRNIHFLLELSRCFEISLSVLLFDAEEKMQTSSTILHSTTFSDGKVEYQLTVEKKIKRDS